MRKTSSTNITSTDDYKRAYEMQKQAREQAEQLLEQKSRELFLKNQSLEQAFEKLHMQQAQFIIQEKLASIGQLGAGLAHELNNPNAFIHNNIVTLNEYLHQIINGMDQYLELIQELRQSLTHQEKDKEIEKKISDIKFLSDVDYIRNDLPAIIEETLNGSIRIKNIANSLRCFTNSDISTQKTVDINECIRKISQQIPTEQKQEVEINFALNSLPEANGTPILLSQAFTNIIVNAIESRPKSKNILVSTGCREGVIHITVKDDGIGIEKENIEKVFQPFYTDKESHNGLGLGISQSIISQHQGTINLSSIKDNGTVVTIKLPLNTA